MEAVNHCICDEMHLVPQQVKKLFQNAVCLMFASFIVSFCTPLQVFSGVLAVEKVQLVIQ